MSIDDKTWRLTHLLDQCHLELGNAQTGDESRRILERYAKQIRQAFADDKTWYMNLQTFEKDGQPMMTGAEWYERFKHEFAKQGPPTLVPRMAYPEEIEAGILNAAKRATGLEES